MGANAQTTVPTFVASQVLTADQQNQSARTGVPVFASTVTRDAAFGGTGEKTLAEGQLCYVEGTGLQTYNAAGTWVTWGAAPSSGALVLISQTSITAAASTTISNCFSSTYRNYLMLVQGTLGTGDTDVNAQLRASGTTTTTNYSRQRLQLSSSTVSTSLSTGGSSWVVSEAGATNPSWGVTFLSNVNVASRSQAITWITCDRVAGLQSNNYWQVQTDSTQFDSIVISVASSTFTGTVSIYGYATT